MSGHVELDEIMDNLSTGDIVLLSGSRTPSRVIMLGSAAARKGSGYGFSHVALVVRVKDNIFLLEATTNKMKAKDYQGIAHSDSVQLVPIKNRLYATYEDGKQAYTRCCVRKLEGANISIRGSSVMAKFIHEVQGRPYDKNLTQWLSAVTRGKFGEQVIDTAEYFCSELVADAYRRVGLISRKENPANFLPDDFAAPTMKLRKGASLGPLIQIKIKKLTVAPAQVETSGTTDFSLWSLHELQDYLLSHVGENEELRDAVAHVHLKKDLIKLCSDLEKKSGVAATRRSTNQMSTGDGKMYVKRSKASYDQIRKQKQLRAKRIARYGQQNAGSASGSHPVTESMGHVRMHTDTSGKNGAKAGEGYHKPSKLIAIEYASLHSPRDWELYERRLERHEKDGRKMKRYGVVPKGEDDLAATHEHDIALELPHYQITNTPLGCHRCWFLFCCRSRSDWSHYGIGVSLYFKYLKYIGYLFLLMFILTLPQLAINGLSVNLESDSGMKLYSLSVGNLGDASLHNGTVKMPFLIPSLNRADVSWYYGLVDALCSIIFFIGYRYLRRAEKREAKHFSEMSDLASVADYSIFVKSCPDDHHITSTDPAQVLKETRKIEKYLREFWTEQVKAEVIEKFGDASVNTLRSRYISDHNNLIVFDVTLVVDHQSDIKFFKTQAPLKLKIEKLDWHTKKLNHELSELPSTAHWKIRALKEQIALQRSQRAIFMKKLLKNQKLYKLKKQRKRDIPKISGAFITFSTDMARHMALKRYPHGFFFWLCQPSRKQYHGDFQSESKLLKYDRHLMTKVIVRKAPEPSTIIWENLSYNWYSRFFRKTLVTLVCLVLIVGSAFAVYYTRQTDLNTACESASGLLQKYANLDCDSFQKNATISGASEELLCKPILDAYDDHEQFSPPFATKDDMFRARVKNGSDTGLEVQCYCRTNFNPSIVKECDSFLRLRFLKVFMTFVASSVILMVNQLYAFIVRRLGRLEKHHSVDSMNLSVSFRVFLGQFINTGLVFFLMNFNLRGSQVLADADNFKEATAHVLQGKYSDFTAEWYADVGQAITLTMLLYIFSPHSMNIAKYLRFKCKKSCCLNAATQHEMNELFLGGNFDHSQRYAQISVSIFICMMYSSGIPLMYFIVLMTTASFYWVDKFMFAYFYRMPARFDEKAGKKFAKLLPLALSLKLFFGIWMLGNKRILSSEDGDVLDITENFYTTNNETSTGIRSISNLALTSSLAATNLGGLESYLSQKHVTPNVTLFAFIIAYSIVERVWHYVGGFVYKIFRLVTCGKCCQAVPHVLRDDFVNEKEEIEHFDIASYNIFENPVYQRIFNISSDFAAHHKHLEDLGNLDQLAGANLKDDTEGP